MGVGGKRDNHGQDQLFQGQTWLSKDFGLTDPLNTAPSPGAMAVSKEHRIRAPDGGAEPLPGKESQLTNRYVSRIHRTSGSDKLSREECALGRWGAPLVSSGSSKEASVAGPGKVTGVQGLLGQEEPLAFPRSEPGAAGRF